MSTATCATPSAAGSLDTSRPPFHLGARRAPVPAPRPDPAERTSYLAERGYTAPHLPSPWGRGADAAAQLVIEEELQAAELEPVDMVIGNWVVPTLISHGTPDQQERFLSQALRGGVVWCQLFGEPGAGSDLAGLSTRAEKVDGGWVLNGQKVWTSMAREAQWGICLARTDPNAPKYRGLSYFLVDMSSPGVTIRPLREITGEALFNEVFLDNVFVGDDSLISQPGDGWKLARTTLANERVSMSRGSSLGDSGEQLLTLAATPGGLDDERLATLGGLLCDAQSTGLLGSARPCVRLPARSPAPSRASPSYWGSSTSSRCGTPPWSGRGPPRSREIPGGSLPPGGFSAPATCRSRVVRQRYSSTSSASGSWGCPGTRSPCPRHVRSGPTRPAPAATPTSRGHTP